MGPTAQVSSDPNTRRPGPQPVNNEPNIGGDAFSKFAHA
jgi:hypothetical protein